MKITQPSDLPPQVQERVKELAARYRLTRLWQTDAEADDAAFKDIRTQYWRGVGLDHHGNPPTNNPPTERTA